MIYKNSQSIKPFTGQISISLHLLITKELDLPFEPLKVFPKVCWKTSPEPSVKIFTSWATTKARSPALSPAKNWIYHHAWSLYKVNFSLKDKQTILISLSMKELIALTFVRKIGFACLGKTWDLACSTLINFRYSLTAWAEAGLPDSETIFQSRPNPISSKMFTSWFIIPLLC